MTDVATSCFKFECMDEWSDREDLELRCIIKGRQFANYFDVIHKHKWDYDTKDKIGFEVFKELVKQFRTIEQHEGIYAAVVEIDDDKVTRVELRYCNVKDKGKENGEEEATDSEATRT